MDLNTLTQQFDSSEFINLEKCSDNVFETGKMGVKAILTHTDHKVEYIQFENHILAYVKSSLNYPAYYPLYPVKIDKPIKAVLMDLDGTSVKSENFWIWIIQKSISSLMDKLTFELEEADLPFVSGHSVSEHLGYCVNKYCPDKTIEEAKEFYFEHTHFEMNEILKGRGKEDAFIPTEGLKDFLYELKSKDIKIGLVTSGLYEKAWPEILSAFKSMNMGNPEDFYDAIITAGFPLRKGKAGTLGELSPKPHPWLYAEICRVGLGIPFEERNNVVGIEDSGAGVCSVRLAGFSVIGMAGGNITSSGTKGLCSHYCNDFQDILATIL